MLASGGSEANHSSNKAEARREEPARKAQPPSDLGRLLPLAPMHGRTAELAELTALLTEGGVRLVTLVGVGGVGKARIALEVASRIGPIWNGGISVVPLAAAPSPELVLTSIAQHLEIATSDEPSTFERLVHVLSGRRHLLVLDNFEHVLPAAPVVGELVRALPGLTVMVTSRSPMHLVDERVVEIAPLPVADLAPDAPAEIIRGNIAVQLFLDRASAVGGRISPADLPTVAEICRSLDGIPLALELAASNTRALPLASIPRRLDDRLDLLAQTPADLPPRHQTLEASISWSFALLGPAERQLFARLSVFTGGFAVEMAVELARGRRPGRGYPWGGIYTAPDDGPVPAGIDAAVAELGGVDRRLDRELPLAALPVNPYAGLRALVDQSLIRLSHGRDGTPRYEMLETIRAFAQARLSESDEEAAVHHAHAALMGAFADVTSDGLWSRRRRQWELERVQDELGNTRSALSWLRTQPAGAELAMRIASGHILFWQLRGLVDEGLAWLVEALALGRAPGWVRADALISVAALNWRQNRTERASQALAEAKALAIEHGITRTIAQAALHQAIVAWRELNFDEMRLRLDEAIPLYTEVHDPVGLGVCRFTYGVWEQERGNAAAAERWFASAVEMLGDVGYEWGYATGLYYLAKAARDRGELSASARLLDNALHQFWQSRDGWGSGAVAGALAALAADHGFWLTAASLLGVSATLCQRVGAVLFATEQEMIERVAEPARIQLGERMYEQLYGEARSLSMEQCVTSASEAANALAREPAEDPRSGRDEDESGPLATLAGLTPRRREILRLVARGMEVKEIARELGRDYNTVDTQLKAIQRAFGVESRSELIVLMHRSGLADLI